MKNNAAVQISRISGIKTYDEPEGCDGIEIFAVKGLDTIFTERTDLPEANRLIVDPRFAVNEGWYVLYWRGGRYVMERSRKKEGQPVKDGPDYVGVVIGWYREEANGPTIDVDGFSVEAKTDNVGLLHLEVSAPGRNVLAVEHPSNGLNSDGSEHQVYTSDPAIIKWELDNSDERDDTRLSHKKLREAAKSKAFREWWGLTNKEAPEDFADRVEEAHRRESIKQAGAKKIEAVSGAARSRN